MALFKATIEVLVEVNNDAEACDAIAEGLRPMLKEFGGECWIDWKYADTGGHPVEHDGKGFEYAEAS